MELDQYLVVYLDVIKTEEMFRGKRFGSQFIADLVEFLELQMEDRS